MQKNRTESPGAAGRWASRPVLSLLIRAFVLLSPMVASFLVAVFVGRAVPRPSGGTSTILWWGSVLLSSFTALYVGQRLVRRLTPVAVLLKLTLTFPDRAPSRYRVARRSGNIAELRKSLEKARRGTDKQSLDEIAESILALSTALSTHDRQTRGHSERVRVFTDMLAEELKVPAAERNRLRWAALLHDIGKLDVPAKILNKPDKLDGDEWAIIKQHPRAGLRFIGVLGTWLGPHATTILHHHERYDGKGYPEGVGGEQISLGARIVSVADSFDTMTAARPYKKPLSAAAARQELSRCAGGQFDPVVVRAMLNISLGRLWWRVGILSWIAQMPAVGPVSQLLGRSLETAIGALRTAAAAATIGLAGATVPLSEDAARQAHEAPPAVVRVAEQSGPPQGSVDGLVGDSTAEKSGNDPRNQGPTDPLDALTGAAGSGETASDAATGGGQGPGGSGGSTESGSNGSGGSSGSGDSGSGSATGGGDSGSGGGTGSGGSGSGSGSDSGSGSGSGSDSGSGTAPPPSEPTPPPPSETPPPSGGGGPGIGGGDGIGGGGGTGGGNPDVGGGPDGGGGNSGSGGGKP